MRPLIVKAQFLLPGPSRHEAARDYLQQLAKASSDDLAAWPETSDYSDHGSSQGLFGPEISGPESQNELVRTLRLHRGPVWKLLVSVHPDDAVELPDLMDRAYWIPSLWLSMPQLAAAMNIYTLRWVGALRWRPATRSPYACILFWSDEPTQGLHNVSGRIHHSITPKALVAIKRLMTSELLAPAMERDALQGLSDFR